MRQFKDWTEAVKSKDNALNELKKSKQKLDLPSVRKLSKIDLEKQKTETSKPAAKATSPPKAKIKDDRIKSTDYRKWDKYDPDEEILRMDLDEERSKELAEQKVSSHQKSATEDELKNEKASLYERLQTQLRNLSQMEREQLAER